jgi:uncharacterized protein (DUF924 family)
MSDWRDVLGFWFGDIPGDIEEKSKMWWGAVDDVERLDRSIEEKFGDLRRQAIDGQLDNWRENRHGCLALIILIDQFSRNIHRGTPQAFENDARALDLSFLAQDHRYDEQLTLPENIFLYMPMMHAEDLDIQKQSVRSFRRLAEQADDFKEMAEGSLEFAVEHKVIIEEFGRFPHRNSIVDRPSTDEEKAFLEDKGITYGQG